MKILKYIKITALTLCCALTLCACSGGEGEESADASSDDSSYSEEDQGQAKVGYIYNQKAGHDNMTYMFEKSRRDMQTALEIDTCYIDDISVSEFEDAVKALKNDGCNIIISASNCFASSAYAYAKKDKEVYVLSYGGNASLTNLTCFQPMLYQPAFICGAAAAWNSNTHKIGVVADDIMFNSYAVIDAFVLGVQQLFKSQETDVTVTFAATEEETEAAVNRLLQADCDVIFSYQESDYAMYCCDSLGIKSIGFTSDLEYSAPEYGLMGYYLSWSTYLTDAVRSCIENAFVNEVYIGGIKQAFVKNTPYSSKCRKDTMKICDSLYDYVKRDKAQIFVGELRDKDGNTRVGQGKTLSHNEILGVEYLVYGVTSVINFIEPIEFPHYSDMTIKTAFVE